MNAVHRVNGATSPQARVVAAPRELPSMDVETMILVAQIDQRDAQEATAQGQLEKQSAERDAQMRAAKEAEARAKAAQDEGGFFHSFVKVFSTVATVAACVAAGASVVASGGASAPLIIAAIGVAMSASSPYVKQALGEKAGDVCMWGGVALSLGGGGMELAGVGAKAAESAATEAKIAAWVARGAHVTEGGARVGEGVFTVKEKGAEADAQDEQANVLARRADAKRAQADVDETIRRLADLEASARRAIGTLLSAQGDETNARAEIVARMGRSVVA